MARKKSHKSRKPSPRGSKKDSSVRITEIPGQVSLERSPFSLRGKIKHLSTNIDGLQKYVTERKTVKITGASRKFGVPKKNIEEWGRILEDHHMIEMHYPVAGEPMLRVPGFDKLRRNTKKHRKDRKEKVN